MNILTFAIFPLTMFTFSVSCFSKGMNILGVIIPLISVGVISYFYKVSV